MKNTHTHTHTHTHLSDSMSFHSSETVLSEKADGLVAN